ncbi:MAG: alanine--tRNA ligase [Atopobiaceae bacterium]|jgi:alanyl-tRNA synthetase|nr:alanine--tRNA ligase [Atopobiaceae bacterium]MCH4180444.1 alanine--tRNA ligase [Atopobiaceae bacterium]MCH4214601.1 alanine--tRNA ligase [Atopobiaceae bacterium]MCH4230407.1 alanine--tRNA ligase [Atopobiaceae bacterium]MCH4275804.1 alanine--tRNA ligase [Atopobiaceae bacterium]
MSETDYPTMTTAQIRDSFLSFFEDKGCKLFPSSSLVPDDPSLLLANAGMNQFKQYFLGTKTMDQIGACSCQKCLRTNDIDAIGLDGRHLSFFEMLGNFSFGGYSKRQACEWAYDFITRNLGLPKDRLYFTIFTDDDDCHDIWRSLGVDEDHISRLGEEDNFWAAGPTGPCGPCSEIYFDQGADVGCGSPDCAPGCECDRFLEFWNLVFTQFDRQEDGTLCDLPHSNVDTGMGLERISAIMQHKSTNYDGDILQSLIGVGERLTHTTYGTSDATDTSLRIMADHSRAVTFMIADGILPSNEGRGYVLRRLLRRAIYHGRILGVHEAFLATYAHEVERLLGGVYPEITANKALIDGIIAAEEERFSTTLETGRTYLDDAMASLEAGAVLPGDIAFALHDTYGFPVDLTREICERAGHAVDMDGFGRLMEQQRSRARAQVTDEVWGTFSDVWVSLSDTIAPTTYIGYDYDRIGGCEVLALVKDGASVQQVVKGDDVEVVLSRTPFYAEMGGEVGDSGELEGIGFGVAVHDTQTRAGGLVSHVCHVTGGTLSVGDIASGSVDVARRALIRRNHTATHLLDAALKRVLGDHVNQAGSHVDEHGLRFDFTHFEAVTADELASVERIVNEQIIAAKPVVTREMPIDEAKASGAVALFGEKYGDVVRVVSVGAEELPFSRELCGGMHATNTAQLGLFKIVSESSVGSNARRIEAVTSQGALDFVGRRLAALDEAAAELKCRADEVPARITSLQGQLKEGEHRLRDALTGSGANKVADAMAAAIDVDGYRCVIARLDGMEAKQLRDVWDTIRDRNGGKACACVLATTTPDGKVALLAAGTDDAVAHGFGAGDLVRQLAEKVGGRGGGRPNMAQAGGKDPSGIDDVLAAARASVASGSVTEL